MEQRTLSRTGTSVSVVGLGTWQLGGDGGKVSERDALTVAELGPALGTSVIPA